MIWYSSSMPSVSDGAFMSVLAARSAMNVGVWLPPPAVTLSSAAVAERVRHAVDVITVRHVRRRVHHALGEHHLAVDQLGYGSVGSAMRCCTMYGSASAVSIAVLHVVVVHLPAEDDALAAVFVVRLEHELVACSAQ